MYRKLASVVLVAAAINAKNVEALGLGEMTMHSALNQPLNAEIKLTNVGDLDETQILVKLGSEDDFKEAGVDRLYFLQNIKFAVKLDKDNPHILLTSFKSVKEPFLDFLVEANWPSGRALRAYTTLVDLPVYKDEGNTAITAKNADQTLNQKAEIERYEGTGEIVEETNIDEATDVKTGSSFAVIESQSSEEVVQRQVKSETASSPETYRVRTDDTLWGVALKVKPSANVSVQQTMIALQQMNPDAFINGNINRLKAGAILRVPDEQTVRDTSARDAIQTVSQQNKEWQNAQLSTAETGATYKAPADDSDGYLSLSSAGAGLANGTDEEGVLGGAATGLNEANERLAVAQLEKEELGQRVSSLTDQVEQLKRLVELKDAELANLQAQLGGEPVEPSEPPVPPAPEEPPKPEVAEASAEQETKSAEAVAAVKHAEEAPKAEKVAPKPAPKAEKKPAKPKPKPAPAPEPSLIDTILLNPIYIGGIALLIILGVVGFLFRRKAKQEQEALDEIAQFEFDALQDQDETGAEDETQLHNVVGDAAATDVEPVELSGDEQIPELDSATASEPEQATTMQTDDAISEADIYIAYGRYEQAVELLNSAIAQAPSDVALHSKLLEVYLESNNREGFRDSFVQLHALGDEAAVAHAKEILSSADGAADWLDDIDTSAPVAQQPEAEAPAAGDEFSLDLEDDSFDLDLDLDQADSAETAAGEQQVEEDDFTLDLDGASDAADDSMELDLDAELAGLESADESVELNLDAEVAEPEVEAGDDSFDLDLSAEFEESAVDATDEPALELDSDAELDAELSLDDAIESLEESDVASEPEVTPEPEQEVDLDLELDLDLDLSDLDQDAPQAEAAPQAEDESQAEEDEEFLSMDGLELELAGGEGETSEEIELSTDELPGDELDLDAELESLDALSEEVDEAPEAELSVDEDLSLDLSDALDDIESLSESDEAGSLDDLETDLAAVVEDLDIADVDEADFSQDELNAALESLDESLEALNDMDEEDGEIQESTLEVAESELDELSVEPSDVSAEEPESEPVAQAAPQEVAEPVESAPIQPLEGDDLEFIGDDDEVATKLNLAQAYLDMGDFDGARDILLEVTKEGSDDQKAQATDLLDSID